MRFLLKYPTRSRPKLFQSQIAAWRETASGENSLQWLVSADADDATMNTPEIREWCAAQGVPIHYGQSKTKIEAVNADMDKAGDDWDVLVLVSDDMIPVAGWDKVIADNMPDDLRCGLWFPDGKRRDLCTLSVFGRPILNEVLGGHIYDPAFKSVCCDDYYHWLMKRAGLLKFVDVMIARHAWREQNNDDLMRRNEHPTTYAADRQTLRRMTREAHVTTG